MKSVHLFLLLALTLVFISGLAAADCPSIGVSGESCVMCGATPCMNNLDANICSGTVNPDYPTWGPLAWIGGSDGCTCYCPYQMVIDYNKAHAADACQGKTCAPQCSGGAAQSGGSCDSGSGECVYSSSQTCDYGCDERTARCNPAPPPESPKTCSNSCSSNEKQRPYPDCECYAPDACASVKCPSYCQTPKTDYATAHTSGECNRQTGKCEFTNTTCTAGCQMDATGTSAQCLPDCEAGTDRFGNDVCKDPACASSPSCSCPLIGTHAGSIGGKSMKILVGGYNFAPGSPFNTYKDRDEMLLADAKDIYSHMGSTKPFDEMSYSIYATRLPTGTLGPWRADLLAKCGGGDFTIFIDYTTNKDPQTRYYSMNVDVYKASTPKDDFSKTVMHEIGHGFAGLWDEYTVAKDINALVGTAATLRDAYVSQFVYGARNCAISDNEAGCSDYFSKTGASFTCVKGCTAASWYRSSEESLMNHVDLANGFNALSQALIRTRIQAFAHPQAPSIHSPIPSGAKGVRQEPQK